jgi:hypothetical protein
MHYINFNFIASLTLYYIEDGKQTRSKNCIAKLFAHSVHSGFFYVVVCRGHIGTKLYIVGEIDWMVY